MAPRSCASTRPGFEEVAAIVPVVTPGKRCATFDLTTAADRARFAELVAGADVVVHGLRPGAMEGLGFGPAELRAINPGIVTARLDAYGWCGPWATRRGFDSLVQMSCGIAAAGGARRRGRPARCRCRRRRSTTGPATCWPPRWSAR